MMQSLRGRPRFQRARLSGGRAPLRVHQPAEGCRGRGLLGGGLQGERVLGLSPRERTVIPGPALEEGAGDWDKVEITIPEWGSGIPPGLPGLFPTILPSYLGLL